jgi:vacuolar protein sorting-associated protein 54
MNNPSGSGSVVPPNLSLNAFNPLRSTDAPRTAHSRGAKAPPPIVLSDMPKVGPHDFETYLAEIKDEWERWQRNQRLGGKGIADMRLDEADVVLEEEEEGRRRQRLAAALMASAGAKGKEAARGLPPLEDVPDVFFEEGFNLANPRTFDIVTERNPSVATKSPWSSLTSPLSSPNSSRISISDLATDQILQEKLSHYLDIVELHLTLEISLRSTSFFSAIANLQSLHSQSSLALSQISSLKEELKKVDQGTALRGLQIVRSARRRRKLEDVLGGVERLKEIWGAVRQAGELAEHGEWEGALNLAEEVEELWRADSDSSTDNPSVSPVEDKAPEGLGIIGEEDEGDADAVSEPDVKETVWPPTAKSPLATTTREHPQPPPPVVQFSKLRALKNIPSRLANLRGDVAKSLQSELVITLTSEMHNRLAQYGAVDGNEELRSETKERIVERVRPMIRGLVRCGGTAVDDAVAAWRDAVAKEVRQVMREVLAKSSPLDARHCRLTRIRRNFLSVLVPLWV